LACAVCLVPSGVFGSGPERTRGAAENLQNKSARMLLTENVGVVDSAIDQFPARLLEIELKLRTQPDSSGTNSQVCEPFGGEIFRNSRQFIGRAQRDCDVTYKRRCFSVVVDCDEKPTRLENLSWVFRCDAVISAKDDSPRGNWKVVNGFRLNNSASRDIGSFDFATVRQLTLVDSVDRPSKPTYENRGYRSNCSAGSFDELTKIKDDERRYMISGTLFLACILILCANIIKYWY